MLSRVKSKKKLD